MKLLYHKNEVPNFGDDLNALLWPQIAPELFKSDQDGIGFLGIGTIVGKQLPNLRKLIVFSSGAGYNPASFAGHDVEVVCVRGPYTAKRLGLAETLAVTDGAILSPLIFEAAPKNGKTLVIPHWETIRGCEQIWQKVCDRAGMALCSPIQDAETVIREISAAELVLTESLHGAILADTYGVPWIAWASTGNFSEFKWMDWMSSMRLDYRVSAVPPPHADLAYRLGRVRADEPASEVARRLEGVISASIADPSFEPPAKTPSAFKQALKLGYYRSGAARVFGGCSPAHTARALLALKENGDRQLSDPDVRQSRHQDMQNRLQKLIADYSSEKLG
ncbi:MAG: polysaccharide pyruvyl transferase family protein [Pseudomonadota bacterium]